MVVPGFEWDDDNIFHIGRHAFSPEEVEEVFAGNHKVRRARQQRYIALGETLDGRLAFVVFQRLSGGLVRVTRPETWRQTSRGYFAADRQTDEEETSPSKVATP